MGGQLLMIQPVPTLSQTFTLILQEEHQRKTVNAFPISDISVWMWSSTISLMLLGKLHQRRQLQELRQYSRVHLLSSRQAYQGQLLLFSWSTGFMGIIHKPKMHSGNIGPNTSANVVVHAETVNQNTTTCNTVSMPLPSSTPFSEVQYNQLLQLLQNGIKLSSSSSTMKSMPLGYLWVVLLHTRSYSTGNIYTNIFQNGMANNVPRCLIWSELLDHRFSSHWSY